MSNNPKTTSYEFLGPLGALAISVGVPIITYALYFACSEATGGCPPQLTSIDERIVASVTNLDWWTNLWHTGAALTYLSWYIFCVLAWAVLPGDQVEGTTLRTGEKKQYKINGTT
jgi:Delta14-sterol reductase